MKPFHVGLLFSLALVSAGCAYLEHRARDLGDCFKASGAVGAGLYAGARATDLLAFQAGWRFAVRWGTDGRARPTTHWLDVGRGWLVGGVRESQDIRSEADEPPYDREDILSVWTRREYGPQRLGRGTRLADRCWFEGEVFLAFAGVRLGFNPLEFADFLGGWLALDLLGDDGPPPARPALPAGVFDMNRDGRADFFLLADASGRITRIAYDRNGDAKPDEIVALDEIPAAQCRHLVIVLDGFGYDVVRRYYDAGGLRMFPPPSRVVPPYPSLTDLCLGDALGNVPCRAYRNRHFSRIANSPVGGYVDYLTWQNSRYHRLLTYRLDRALDGFAYLLGQPLFEKELRDLKRQFDRRHGRVTAGYLTSSAAVSTRSGEAGQLRCLRSVERLVNRILWQTRGLTKITLLADHGHAYQKPRFLDLAAYLEGKGWRRTNHLAGPRDFHQITLGLVTFASFATRDPAALAVALAACDGVDLASYVEGDRVIVVSRDGKAAIHKRNGRYAYKRVRGDPLRLAGLLAHLRPDADGCYDPDDLLRATATHDYPAPLQRLWRAHFALAENVPDVLASLDGRFYTGRTLLNRLVRLRSTHGNLNYRNSVTFLMSTLGPLPAVMRSRDIPRHLRRLTGAPWPLGH